jgi:hypothetical protein
MAASFKKLLTTALGNFLNHLGASQIKKGLSPKGN